MALCLFKNCLVSWPFVCFKIDWCHGPLFVSKLWPFVCFKIIWSHGPLFVSKLLESWPFVCCKIICKSWPFVKQRKVYHFDGPTIYMYHNKIFYSTISEVMGYVYIFHQILKFHYSSRSIVKVVEDKKRFIFMFSPKRSFTKCFLSFNVKVVSRA